MVSTEQLLDGLTAEQQEAVRHVDGPLLIVAGPGSGKTRVVTRRIAYLIKANIPMHSILAVTFTNKAAAEMQSRVKAQGIDWPGRNFGWLVQTGPMICTFHSLCLRFLRYFSAPAGLEQSFTIFDSGDQAKVVKEALKMLDMSANNFPPSTMHSAISDAKNRMLTPEKYAAQAHDFYSRQVARVYAKYQSLLENYRALDFDDLLLRTLLTMQSHPDTLQIMRERFRYIMVDEYQDTNEPQYLLCHALAEATKNICVVGDPDQSIYAWRGADIRNILEFERDYPNAKVVKLEQNFRSTKTIVEIASELIARNSQRKAKSLWTENPQGERATVLLCQDEDDEAREVARRFKDYHEKQGIAWSKMAIFYRMNSLSRAVEDAIRMEGIPYIVARGTAFYERKEVKDVLAYLRVIANDRDEVSLERIVNTPPRGLGDASLNQIQAAAISAGVTTLEMLGRASEVPGVSARAANAARAFVALVAEWRRIATEEMTSDDIFAGSKGRIQRIMEDVVRRSGIEAALRKGAKADAEDEDPLGNVNGLITEAGKFDHEFPDGTLDDFLAGVSLRTDVDALREGEGAVTLMTLHAAKGLEFPVVAMIGLEEGVLPHSRARGNMEELEEERRLCFVGITRAQEHLILTKAAYRTIRGLRERTVTSPFFGEMPQKLLDVTDRTALPTDEETDLERRAMRELAEEKAGRFRKGMTVRHPTFGIGRIADLSNIGANTRAVVDFNSAGRKTLILEYARLEPVG